MTKTTLQPILFVKGGCRIGLRSEIQTDTGKHTLDRVEKNPSYNGPPTPELFSQGHAASTCILYTRMGVLISVQS